MGSSSSALPDAPLKHFFLGRAGGEQGFSHVIEKTEEAWSTLGSSSPTTPPPASLKHFFLGRAKDSHMKLKRIKKYGQHDAPPLPPALLLLSNNSLY